MPSLAWRACRLVTDSVFQISVWTVYSSALLRAHAGDRARGDGGGAAGGGVCAGGCAAGAAGGCAGAHRRAGAGGAHAASAACAHRGVLPGPTG